MRNKPAHRATQLDLLLVDVDNFPVPLSRTIGDVHFLANLQRESSEKQYVLFHTVTPSFQQFRRHKFYAHGKITLSVLFLPDQKTQYTRRFHAIN